MSVQRRSSKKSSLKKWLHRIQGNEPSLVNQLNDYPVYRPPHIASPKSLSSTQAQDNFEFFNTHRPERLALVLALLNEWSLELSAEEYSSNAVNALDAWAYEHWPDIYRESLQQAPLQGFGVAQTELQIRSFLFDVTMLVGQWYCRAHAEFSWALDDSQESRDCEAYTYNRIILKNQTGKPVLVDPEDHVFYHYKAQGRPRQFTDVDYTLGRRLGNLHGY